MWELVSTGQTTLPREDGAYQIVVAGDGWFDVVKWLYQHIDGPPKMRAEVDGSFIVNFISNVDDDKL